MTSMTKKCILVLVLACIAVGGAFAMSVGGGGYITKQSGGGYEQNMGFYTFRMKMPYFGFGAFVFLDVDFAELSVGFARVKGDIKVSGGGQSQDLGEMKATALDFGLMLKYPMPMSQQLQLFPMVGVVYRRVISGEAFGAKAEDPGDASALWIKGGVGVDYLLSSSLFLRAEGLYGFRFSTKDERVMVEENGGGDTKLGHGLDIKIAVGYLF